MSSAEEQGRLTWGPQGPSAPAWQRVLRLALRRVEDLVPRRFHRFFPRLPGVQWGILPREIEQQSLETWGNFTVGWILNGGEIPGGLREEHPELPDIVELRTPAML